MGNQDFGTAWERKAEVAQVASLLDDRQRNLLLVGPSGVGKTTILVDAVRLIYRNMAAERKQPKESDKQFDTAADLQFVRPEKTPLFWSTNAARLISGMQYLGQWEERCEKIVEELAEVRGVLCVENLLDLVLTGGQSPESSLAASWSRHMECAYYLASLNGISINTDLS